MNDVIELENRIDEQGMRVVHLMANRPLTATDLIGYWPPEGARVETAREVAEKDLDPTKALVMPEESDFLKFLGFEGWVEPWERTAKWSR